MDSEGNEGRVTEDGMPQIKTKPNRDGLSLLILEDSHSMPHPTSQGTTEEGSPSFRDPSKVFYQGDHIRRSILVSYWIVIILALPLWWYTTSIERLSLPSSRVYAQAEKDLQFPVKIELEIPAPAKNGPSLATQLQELLNERIFRAPQKWKGIDIHVSSKRHVGESVSSTEEHFFMGWILLSVSPDSPNMYTITPDRGEVSVQNRHLTFPLGDRTCRAQFNYRFKVPS